MSVRKAVQPCKRTCLEIEYEGIHDDAKAVVMAEKDLADILLVRKVRGRPGVVRIQGGLGGWPRTKVQFTLDW